MKCMQTLCAWEKRDQEEIRGDCGSFPCIQYYDWMSLEQFSWGRNVYVTWERKENSMEVECIPIIAMKNG